MTWQSRQRGASFIGLTITLAVIAYGLFVGIQYAPQHIEAMQVRNILDSVHDQGLSRRYSGADEVWAVIDRQLFINEMGDMKQYFNVAPVGGGGWSVSVRYERELNLLFKVARMPHEYSISVR